MAAGACGTCSRSTHVLVHIRIFQAAHRVDDFQVWCGWLQQHRAMRGQRVSQRLRKHTGRGCGITWVGYDMERSACATRTNKHKAAIAAPSRPGKAAKFSFVVATLLPDLGWGEVG